MRQLIHEHRADIRRRLLEGPQSFASDWAKERTVVPVEEIDDPASSAVVAALSSLDHDLIAVTTEELGAEWPDQGVVVSAEEFSGWWTNWASFDVLVAAGDLSAAALLSVDEFALIAGTREFVESALGRAVEEALAEFADYADEMSTASRHLRGIARRYA